MTTAAVKLISDALAHRGGTMGALARDLGISLSHLSNAKAGRYSLSTEAIGRLSRIAEGAVPDSENGKPAEQATRARRLAEAERFLSILDAEAESWCFQTFDDSGRRGDLARVFHGERELADLFDTLDAMNKAGAGVFVTVNEVEPGAPRKAANVRRVRAVFADFDGTAPPEVYPLAPVLEVESSPGKRHAYWTVDGLALADFEDQQRGIAAALGSDPVVVDLPRVMRLPGFRHMKNPARPAWVRIIGTDERLPYTPEAIAAAFPPVPKANGTSGERPDPGSDPVAQALDARGLVLRENPGGGLFITCPWEGEHTTPSTPTSTVYYPPHTGGYAGAAFKCQHSHCQDRTAADLRRWLGLGDAAADFREPDDWPEPRPLPVRGDIGEAAPFPMDLLPAPLQAAAREVARFVKAPEASAALVGIGALATAIGKRALVVERPGLAHHPALFLVGIAPSGERKSPVFRAMTRPLKDWTEAQGEQWEADTRRAKARNTAIDAALTAAKGKAKGKAADVDAAARDIEALEQQREPVPPYPRLFTTDATEQRLFQLMHDRDGAFAVLSGEGRPVFDAIAGKYSGDGRTGDGIYLAGVSGDTITRDRVGGESGPEDRVIPRPCLTVCVLVQPDKYLEAATHPALRASGALARIWPVWLPSRVGQRIEAPDEAGLNDLAMQPFTALVRRLLDHTPPDDPETGRPAPHRASLSPEAAEARRLFHNAAEAMMGEGGELADVADIASKAISQTAKLAIILHLAASPEVIARPSSQIDAATWAAAQTIGTWFLTEAVRVQRLADEDPALDAARRVLRWLKTEARATVTTSDLMTIGPRPRPKARQAAETLDNLEDLGWLRAETAPGKRRPVYRVHPNLPNLPV